MTNEEFNLFCIHFPEAAKAYDREMEEDDEGVDEDGFDSWGRGPEAHWDRFAYADAHDFT
jgi:hypothetical protein